MKTHVCYGRIFLCSSSNEKKLSDICRENKNIHIDMDMSYTTVLHIKVAYRVPHK
jgi:hypothetical protein